MPTKAARRVPMGIGRGVGGAVSVSSCLALLGRGGWEALLGGSCPAPGAPTSPPRSTAAPPLPAAAILGRSGGGFRRGLRGGGRGCRGGAGPGGFLGGAPTIPAWRTGAGTPGGAGAPQAAGAILCPGAGRGRPGMGILNGRVWARGGGAAAGVPGPLGGRGRHGAGEGGPGRGPGRSRGGGTPWGLRGSPKPKEPGFGEPRRPHIQPRGRPERWFLHILHIFSLFLSSPGPRGRRPCLGEGPPCGAGPGPG